MHGLTYGRDLDDISFTLKSDHDFLLVQHSERKNQDISRQFIVVGCKFLSVKVKVRRERENISIKRSNSTDTNNNNHHNHVKQIDISYWISFLLILSSHQTFIFFFFFFRTILHLQVFLIRFLCQSIPLV